MADTKTIAPFTFQTVDIQTVLYNRGTADISFPFSGAPLPTLTARTLPGNQIESCGGTAASRLATSLNDLHDNLAHVNVSGTRIRQYRTLSAGVNEQQTVLINATGGTFTISFGGYTTSALAYDATAGTVQTALEALTSIGAGNIAVSLSNSTYNLTFQGTLAKTNVAQVTADASSLTGPNPFITVTTTVPGVPNSYTIVPRSDCESAFILNTAGNTTVVLDLTHAEILPGMRFRFASPATAATGTLTITLQNGTVMDENGATGSTIAIGRYGVVDLMVLGNAVPSGPKALLLYATVHTVS